MTTITVPINAELQQFIEEEIESGKSETKARVVRYALLRLKEERGLERLMEAEDDIVEGRIYQGSLKALAKKIK